MEKIEYHNPKNSIAEFDKFWQRSDNSFIIFII